MSCNYLIIMIIITLSKVTKQTCTTDKKRKFVSAIALRVIDLYSQAVKSRIFDFPYFLHHFHLAPFIKFLVEKGADKEAKDKDGQIPLQLSQTCSDDSLNLPFYKKIKMM
jgi:hypothetical protein